MHSKVTCNIPEYCTLNLNDYNPVTFYSTRYRMRALTYDFFAEGNLF